MLGNLSRNLSWQKKKNFSWYIWGFSRKPWILCLRFAPDLSLFLRLWHITWQWLDLSFINIGTFYTTLGNPGRWIMRGVRHNARESFKGWNKNLHLLGEESWSLVEPCITWLTKKMRFKPSARWIYSLLHTSQQSNVCMLLGCGYRNWETRVRAEVRSCAHVKSFSERGCWDWFLHYFAKKVPRNVTSWRTQQQLHFFFFKEDLIQRN